MSETSVEPPPHVDVGDVVDAPVRLLEQVVVEESRLFLPVDDFEADARLPFDFPQDLPSVSGVAHRRGGTGAEVRHVVELHEVAEALQHVDHHLLARLRDLAAREHVLAQAEGHADEHEFLEAVASRVAVEALDEQTRAVRADVDGGEVNGFHSDRPCGVLPDCGRGVLPRRRLCRGRPPGGRSWCPGGRSRLSAGGRPAGRGRRLAPALRSG